MNGSKLVLSHLAGISFGESSFADAGDFGRGRDCSRGEIPIPCSGHQFVFDRLTLRIGHTGPEPRSQFNSRSATFVASITLGEKLRNP